MQITPEAFRQRFSRLQLDANGMDVLLSTLKPLDLAAGDKLLTSAQFNDTLYLVWSGRLLVTVTLDGKKLTLGEVEPGRWAGDIGFIEPDAAVADVTAKEDTTVLALSQDGLKALCVKSMDAASALLQALSIELARRLRATSIHQLEEREGQEYVLRRPPAEGSKGWLELLRKLLGLGANQR